MTVTLVASDPSGAAEEDSRAIGKGVALVDGGNIDARELGCKVSAR